MDPHECPKSGPMIKGPHSTEESSQGQGPHMDHGHFMHKIPLILSNF